MSQKNEFLEKLAALIEEYDAELTYTTDDDGIHVYINGGYILGDEIFTGYIKGKDGADNLRNAKIKNPGLPEDLFNSVMNFFDSRKEMIAKRLMQNEFKGGYCAVQFMPNATHICNLRWHVIDQKFVSITVPVITPDQAERESKTIEL